MADDVLDNIETPSTKPAPPEEKQTNAVDDDIENMLKESGGKHDQIGSIV